MKADPDLANVNPDLIPMPIKHGIAPALAAEPRGPFWMGREGTHTCSETNGVGGMTEEQKRTVDCYEDNEINRTGIEFLVGEARPEKTARQEAQSRIRANHDNILPEAERTDQQASAAPNVYTDGSLSNPKTLFWQI